MNSDTQAASIRQSIQAEAQAKDAKDELVRELVEALSRLYETGAPEGISLTAHEMQARFSYAHAVLRKAGAYNG